MLRAMSRVIRPFPSPRRRKSFAFYIEANIPVFSPKMAITGFHSLEITAAGRYEQFRNNDTDVAVPKVGVRWQPFDEQLTLRATWGQGFREPTLEELFAAPISGLKLSHDPQNGGAFEPETNFLVLSNKNLKPEDSETYSAGFVWTPKYVPGLTYSVDAWGVRRPAVSLVLLQRMKFSHASKRETCFREKWLSATSAEASPASSLQL